MTDWMDSLEELEKTRTALLRRQRFLASVKGKHHRDSEVALRSALEIVERRLARLKARAVNRADSESQPRNSASEALDRPSSGGGVF